MKRMEMLMSTAYTKQKDTSCDTNLAMMMVTVTLITRVIAKVMGLRL